MNDINCPKCGYPNAVGRIQYLGIYTAGRPCDSCGYLEMKSPRQILVYEDRYKNDLYLIWDDTNAPLNKDELRDVAECYNQLLVQQYADGLE